MEEEAQDVRRRAVTDLDLPLLLDRTSAVPLTRQLIGAVREAVLDGRLATGSRLPSSRTLAHTIGVSRIVVTEAYAQLISEGYLDALGGSGTRVARVETLHPDGRRSEAPASGGEPRDAENVALAASSPGRVAPFQTGATLGDTGGAVAAALRAAARSPLPVRYGDSRGEPAARAAIAGYLARSRGLVVDADEVILTTGTTQSTDLVLRALTRPGDVAAHEDPSHPGVPRLFRAHGLVPLLLPVDGDGAQIAALRQAERNPRVVHVTPSHQFPLGVRMTIARRSELVSWAVAHDALILEDDYDSEYRYDGPPLPAMSGLAHSHGIYLGTLSKVVSPALRCGYIVAPLPAAEQIAALKELVDGPLPWPMQQVALNLIESGDLERHVRRTRLRYGRIRAALQEGLKPLGDLVALGGIETGLHVVIHLHPRLDAAQIAARSRAAGLMVTDLADYSPTRQTRGALVLGYGAMSEEGIRAKSEEFVNIVFETASRA